MQTYETKESAEKAANHYQDLYESCKKRYEEKELEQYFHSTLRGVFTCFASIIATIVIVADTDLVDLAIWQAACALVLISIPAFFWYFVFGAVFDGFHWTPKLFRKWLILIFLISTIALCLLSH